MIQLLLVDDEAKTRNGLLNHIDWEKLGIDMLQTAKSAEEAMEICRQYQPDIILSDIRMRRMNGLEMCAALRKKYPSCKIVIISGYADKEYLKAAIELGSVSYVEKPIDLEELEQALRKTVAAVLENRKSIHDSERLIQNREFLKKETFYSLLKIQKAEGTAELRELLPREFSRFRVCILRFSKPVMQTAQWKKKLFQDPEMEAFIKAEGYFYGEFTDNRHMVILLCGEPDMISDESRVTARLKLLCKSPWEDCEVFLALGDRVESPGEICVSYDHAKEAEKAVFYLGYRAAEAYSGRKQNPLPPAQDYLGGFKGFLLRGDRQAARSHIQELTKTFRGMQVESSAYVLSIYFEMEKAIVEEFERLSLESREKRTEKYQSEMQIIGSLDTMEEIEAHLIGQIEELFAMIQKDQNNSFMVTRVIRYINENYRQTDISVKQIASELYITPTYLSSLFKRKTGNTIGEYLTKVRMEHSVKLLLEPRMKIYEVAQAVGYEDANYFAKIFKREYGITPLEYRARRLGSG